MYVSRLLENTVRRLTQSFPVVMVTGPRQSGKTTMLRKLSSPNRRFVSLDDLELRRLAQSEPGLFMRQFPPPVLIDEFQYAPDILIYIKIAVDELTTRGKNRQAAGLYWLTGSQHFGLMKGVRESLAGRVALLERGFYSSYVQTHLERDVTTMGGVRNLEAFATFNVPAGRAHRAAPQLLRDSTGNQ